MEVAEAPAPFNQSVLFLSVLFCVVELCARCSLEPSTLPSLSSLAKRAGQERNGIQSSFCTLQRPGEDSALPEATARERSGDTGGQKLWCLKEFPLQIFLMAGTDKLPPSFISFIVLLVF